MLVIGGVARQSRWPGDTSLSLSEGRGRLRDGRDDTGLIFVTPTAIITTRAGAPSNEVSHFPKRPVITPFVPQGVPPERGNLSADALAGIDRCETDFLLSCISSSPTASMAATAGTE